MQVFITVNNVGIKINANANAKEYGTKDLSGIQVIVSVNAIYHVIVTMKTVSAGKNYLINWLNNVLNILMK